jgi:hypothetical protein
MKTISLRTLLRDPYEAKRWTRAGQPVLVIVGGQPLWLLQPPVAAPDEKERRRATEDILGEVLREKPSRVSAARLLERSRR